MTIVSGTEIPLLRSRDYERLRREAAQPAGAPVADVAPAQATPSVSNPKTPPSRPADALEPPQQRIARVERPVHADFRRLRETAAFGGLSGNERRRAEVLLGELHFDMSERARLVLRALCDERNGGNHDLVPVELLHEVVTSPRTLPPSADLLTHLRRDHPPRWRNVPPMYWGEHAFAHGREQATSTTLSVDGSRIEVITADRTLGREYWCPSPYEAKPVKRFPLSLAEVGRALALLPRSALERIARVVVEPRFPPVEREWHRTRTPGAPRIAEYGDRTLQLFPLPVERLSSNSIPLLSEAAHYEICRSEGVQRFGADVAAAAWDPYRAAAKQDVLAPSSGALDDLMQDFGETRALFLLVRETDSEYALANLFARRWEVLRALPALDPEGPNPRGRTPA